jgi:protein required for attachment to host cells
MEVTMKEAPALILVADGAHARLISHTSDTDDVVWQLASDDATKRTEELGSDRPGRAFDSTGQGRHAMEPRTPAHRAAQMAFAHTVAAAVKNSLAGTAFRKFVLVAPPRTLGDLRRELDEDSDIVTAEVAKDFAALTPSDVVARVKAADIIL